MPVDLKKHVIELFVLALLTKGPSYGYKLVYDLKIDTIEGLDYHSSLSGHTTYYYPTNFRLEEYNE